MGAEAPTRLDRDGEMLTLHIYNYDGPAKQFWQYRSLSGPFFAGNVRNAVVVEVAPRAEFSDLEAFASSVADARIADNVDPAGVREIAYASARADVRLAYSLKTMQPQHPVRRAPLARAGASDGDGLQVLLSADPIVRLGAATLLAGGCPVLLAADDAARRWDVLKTSGREVPLWLETPAGAIACDAFGFGRLSMRSEGDTLDVAIEASAAIGPCRIETPACLRLSLNGADVTVLAVERPGGVHEFVGASPDDITPR
jgi:hypothetical protein